MSDLDQAMTTQRVACSLLLLMNIIIFVMIAFLIVKPLKVYIKCIKEDRRMEITGAYEFKYLALTYNDIYELNGVNQVLKQHQAEYDPLTGVLSRSCFEKVKELTRLKPRPIALLLIDTDIAGQVSRRYGYETGDKALKKVGRMLNEHFRASDFPARTDGDQFALIMDEVEPGRQANIVQKLKDINRQLSHPKDGLPPVSIRVGGAFSPEGFTEELYQKANAALNGVKRDGHGGCRFYKEGMELPADQL